MEEFYIPPKNVVSPKNSVSNVKVLIDKGAGRWSLVSMKWDGEDCLGVRWNGEDCNNGIGNPQSRGLPTWFVIPNEISDFIKPHIDELKKEN